MSIEKIMERQAEALESIAESLSILVVQGKPTVVNNVETLANITDIIEKGAKWFSAIGTKDSKGTKVFALSGNVKYACFCVSGDAQIPSH